MFCAMDHRAGWIREKAATSLNPSQVETTLVQLNEQWPAYAEATAGRPANAVSIREVVQQFPLGEAALLHLLAVSSICATRLTRNPEMLLWLAQPEGCPASRSRAGKLAGGHGPARGNAGGSARTDERFWGRQQFRSTTVLERPRNDARGRARTGCGRATGGDH